MGDSKTIVTGSADSDTIASNFGSFVLAALSSMIVAPSKSAIEQKISYISPHKTLPTETQIYDQLADSLLENYQVKEVGALLPTYLDIYGWLQDKYLSSTTSRIEAR